MVFGLFAAVAEAGVVELQRQGLVYAAHESADGRSSLRMLVKPGRRPDASVATWPAEH
ncbi:MAG: hypothetical protein M5R42_06620 [Rhodocyclaceae bacterium]|nr:hypothetical protein [Rhodocyclaceae bacterium]